MATNDTIGIEMPAAEFFRIVHRGMYYEILDTSKEMSDRTIEDVVIADGGRYRVVYGKPVADDES